MRKVRFAKPSDYGKFSELWKEYKERKMHGIAPVFDEAKFTEEADSSIIICIDESDAIVGLMNIGDVGGGTVKIFDWYAENDCFEIEAEMLKYVEDIAKELEFKRLMFWNFDHSEDCKLAHHHFRCVGATDEFEKLI